MKAKDRCGCPIKTGKTNLVVVAKGCALHDKEFSHYGHNVDVTGDPFHCSDCEVDLTEDGATK